MLLPEHFIFGFWPDCVGGKGDGVEEADADEADDLGPWAGPVLLAQLLHSLKGAVQQLHSLQAAVQQLHSF